MSGFKYVALCFLCAAGTLLGASANAQWTGKGDIGASIATGNSENEAFSGGLEVKKKSGSWQHTLGAAADYGNDGETTRRNAGNYATRPSTTSRRRPIGSARRVTRTIDSASSISARRLPAASATS